MFNRTVAKGIGYLLQKQGYILLREYPSVCTKCSKAIKAYDVQKGNEEPIEIDLCDKCMIEELQLDRNNIMQKVKGLIGK